MEFVHLHVNTEFSLLKSACKIEKLVRKAKKLNYSALAITDRNVMYGVVPFYKACLREGIKPIIGLELSVLTPSTRTVILLAKNNKGYQNLMKLSSISQIVGAHNELGIEKKHLFKYAAGLIAIFCAKNGEVQQCILQGNVADAITRLNEYRQHFGEDQVFVGVDHQQDELMNFCHTQGANILAVSSVRYIDKEDTIALKCLTAIDQGTTIKQVHEDKQVNPQHLKSKEEVIRQFSNVPKAIDNTKKIADQCQVTLHLGVKKLPKYSLPEGVTAREYLYMLCYQGLTKKYEIVTSEIEERLIFELEVINKMKFNDYFLIVWDFMRYAHEKNIITGPGRGSAAGSLVAFVLNITDVDPIKYGLLFERFLNPERVSMPDIDIDFPDTKREEVIRYVYEKYGKNHVAQIITFGTLAAKAALRDVGKVIEIPTSQIDYVSKKIPAKPGVTIEEAVKQSEQIQKLIKGSPEIRRWFELAQTVEGLPRHASTHAAGIIISEDSLTNTVPLQKGHQEVYLTQYPMNILEEIGLLKIDFLGLRNLSFMEEITEHIYAIEGHHFSVKDLPFNDIKTFELLGNGDTTGVFQLESLGMRKVLTQLKPTEFEDIVAVNALYRPGPMDYIPIYIDGKHKKREISYIHQDLKPILEKTYGVIIYQEQIMQIASKLAGFSLGEADILRRAVSKKKLEDLENQRKKFVQGCLRRNYDQDIAEQVYDLIVRFANYGFNRSHAVAYSVISYQLAYLKANYPTAFFAALLTSAVGQHQKTNQSIVDAKRKGIKVLPPCINKSENHYTVENPNEIRLSLSAIKNVGLRAVDEIVHEREKDGNYKDFLDFCVRIDSRIVNRRAVESLILAGCFEGFNEHRSALLASLDEIVDYAEKVKASQESDQTYLFINEIKKPSLIEVPPFREDEILKIEKEIFGFYFSGHPIEAITTKLVKYKRTFISNVRSSSKVRVAGYVESVRIIKTKIGQQMAFVKLTDETGEIDLTVFPNQYQTTREFLTEGNLLLVEGKVEDKQEQKQMVVDKVKAINDLPYEDPLKSKQLLYLKVTEEVTTLKALKNVFSKYPGEVKIVLYYEHSKKTLQLSEQYAINASEECMVKIKAIIGEENIVLKTY